jgi:hypothetical protein
MPILGIMASGMSGNLWAPGKDFDSIATVTPYTTVSTVVFSSIPQTYRHLQIRAIGRTTRTAGGADDNLKVTLNSDTTYSWHYLLGDGASASAGGGSSSSAMLQVGLPGATATTAFSATIIDLLDYTSTTKNKTIKTLSGYDTNGGGFLGLSSGLDYATPAAITSITISSWNAANFVSNCHWALYGIK